MICILMVSMPHKVLVVYMGVSSSKIQKLGRHIIASHFAPSSIHHLENGHETFPVLA